MVYKKFFANIKLKIEQILKRQNLLQYLYFRYIFNKHSLFVTFLAENSMFKTFTMEQKKKISKQRKIRFIDMSINRPRP